jgi:hypothetical protein
MSVLDYKRFRNIHTGKAFAALNGLAAVIVYVYPRLLNLQPTSRDLGSFPMIGTSQFS